MNVEDAVTIVRRVKRGVVRYIPEPILLAYHFALAVAALALYRNPSRHLVVIGVTGTKGKTTTAAFIHAALTAAGEKVGLFSTVEMRIGDKVAVNTRHMTLPGRGYVQRYLRAMVQEGCTYAVIETPSEAIRHFRVLGVQYDSVVFTNLSPEHLVTHKTFERYRAVKGVLFRNHARSRQKVLNGRLVKRFVLINADDGNADYFSNLSGSSLSEQILFGFSKKAAVALQSGDGGSFSVDGSEYTTPFPGTIAAYNAAPAVILAQRYCSASPKDLRQALSSVVLRGRLEPMTVADSQPFRVYCDYAHEPLSIKSVCTTLRPFVSDGGRLILLTGAVGGSRWKYNAEEIGETAGRYADVVVISNNDPYFDDPSDIATAVVRGLKKVGKATWHEKLDRRAGIAYALSQAKKGDVVVIAGKGAETTYEVNGESRHWDERAIIREELKKVLV
ncbi:MAG: UDP-N-acetylmuramyl-tripeptide synthetase [Candidatus Kaiserbacteria bacterium]|nr:UDP-N-acetylmuramyl-tripeptide synthetase [Candidatus Kaiserbacteria bacterium]